MRPHLTQESYVSLRELTGAAVFCSSQHQLQRAARDPTRRKHTLAHATGLTLSCGHASGLRVSAPLESEKGDTHQSVGGLNTIIELTNRWSA